MTRWGDKMNMEQIIDKLKNKGMTRIIDVALYSLWLGAPPTFYRCSRLILLSYCKQSMVIRTAEPGKLQRRLAYVVTDPLYFA